jgi:acyl carrier protein
MSTEQILAVVLDVLKEVQQISGRAWEGLPPTAKPVGDLAGFDSLCSVEATVMVEEKLGCGELKTCSFFISDEGQALTIQEITARIQGLISTLKGKR